MDYQKIYDNLIIIAKSKKRKKLKKTDEHYIYYESHHILPRCLGGTDENENLVLLTAKEHYIVHELLTKIYTTNRKLSCALLWMSGNKKYIVSSRQYEYSRLQYQKTPMSDETKEKLRNAIKGVKHTDERNKHKSLVQKGKSHRKYTTEGKLNCSNGQKKLYENGYISPKKGIPITNNQKEKLSKAISIPIIQYDLSMNIIKIWNSAKEAEEKDGFIASCISYCANGKRMTHKNFKWKKYGDMY